MSNSHRNDKQLQYIQIFDQDLQKWLASQCQFSLAFDNVDEHVRRRHLHRRSKNEMCHMVQALAFKDRMQGLLYPFLPRITPCMLLPNDSDVDALVKEMAILV